MGLVVQAGSLHRCSHGPEPRPQARRLLILATGGVQVAGRVDVSGIYEQLMKRLSRRGEHPPGIRAGSSRLAMGHKGSSTGSWYSARARPRVPPAPSDWNGACAATAGRPFSCTRRWDVSHTAIRVSHRTAG